MTYTSEYEALLTKQYWEKTNARAEIAMQAGTWERIFNFLKLFEEEFDIDEAYGDRLDIIGNIVGIDRLVHSVLAKLFFGFDDNVNSTGFDDKFEELGDLGVLYNKFASQYDDLQLDDPDFRFFIKAKIKENIAHGVMLSDDFTSMQIAIVDLFEGLAYVQDNFDMSLTLHISPLVNDDRVRIIIALGVLPKPQGVRYILVQSDPTNNFGFSNNVNCKGFKNKDDPLVEAGGYFLRKLL